MDGVRGIGSAEFEVRKSINKNFSLIFKKYIKLFLFGNMCLKLMINKKAFNLNLKKIVVIVF